VQELLSFYGINLSNQLVLDKQNAAFPVIVTRDAGGMQINEVQAVNYPFFIDVRQNGMADDNMILANLTAVSMNWTSLIKIESAAVELLDTENLLVSSPDSWVTDNTNIQPDFETYPEIGFQVGENPQSYPLAVAVQGSLPSYFAGQPIPEVTNNDGSTIPAANATIERSTENARIIVFGSTALVDDFALQLSNQLSQDYYVNNLRLIQNAVDWSVEDTDLLSIRSRGTAIRVLAPMENSQQLFWEISTYIIVIMLLMAIFIYWRYYQKKNQVILFDTQSTTEAQHE
jgi:ABC-2 type transport system permease protein